MQKEEEVHKKILQSKVRQMCNCFCCGYDRPLEGYLRKLHISNIVPVEYSSLKIS